MATSMYCLYVGIDRGLNVCMYVCVCVCMHVCMYVHACHGHVMYVCMYVCTRLSWAHASVISWTVSLEQ